MVLASNRSWWENPKVMKMRIQAWMMFCAYMITLDDILPPGDLWERKGSFQTISIVREVVCILLENGTFLTPELSLLGAGLGCAYRSWNP